jgi:hypothetical protein
MLGIFAKMPNILSINVKNHATFGKVPDFTCLHPSWVKKRCDILRRVSESVYEYIY